MVLAEHTVEIASSEEDSVGWVEGFLLAMMQEMAGDMGFRPDPAFACAFHGAVCATSFFA